MKKEYDILVIGSGLGGLVSALILAKEGMKVVILEKNNQYGGNLQTFSRNKKIFDTGVHYLGGLSEGQNLHRYFSYLEIMDDLEIHQMDEDGYDHITFGEEATAYPHAQGYENFIAQLSHYFPAEKENIENYCEGIRYVCSQFPLYNLAVKEQYNEEVLHLNTRRFIESITSDKKLQSVLLGANFLYAGNSEDVPFYVHALTVNSYMQSAYKCVKGGSQISRLLIRKLREYGAEVYKHTEVSELVFDEWNILRAAKTTGGKVFTAKQFISNVDIRAAVKLIGEKRLKKSFLNRIMSWEPTSSCFSVYMVLKPKSIRHFNHNVYHYASEDSVWNAFRYRKEQWPENYMLSCTSSRTNPEFAESLTAISYMDFEEVKQWEDTVNTVVHEHSRGEAYEHFKKEKAEAMIGALEKKIPDIRQCIDHVYTSSPLSYRDYIGSFEGNMYGYLKNSENPLKTMVSPRTKIDNLFLTGQSVNMHGILGVTIGAFGTCAEILGKELISERLNALKGSYDKQ
ncbi:MULTISPECIES: phytoene desaturase family protein [Chryseobacterium]|uniref:All-trans-retinol 13,14-reductase n=1 Tax=Chryseobacterium camelliae TaxID=1265445 RepID=A0ABU0TLK5_9FLAO|nr:MULTISPECIES: NAD(P)/FAD-dependent oxidoreductase [Chryseobacterium]MDT3408213.1 all-trans-retinol 13,14-reductase [Pseudacidovorax intermedius]MDQ1097933.1 all-trans-retinol 13,14-reductase [Chryseobacterium camelliae]MDQ1101864.1 all-trans-retinol 13,14-reductase [Chryseobacterium sp. SORGH_AS_1048]MDR6085304.1 all-trans-retinol 13,14-reductase [Chryseobacterium sp. SORGH_AS_0909]MDR6129661.1 all-trans-retinol 13,14-reductase [Chryseobacterium sp. SORGH_AS_1175]